MMVGRHKVMTFGQLFQTNRAYRRWVQQSVEAQELSEPQYQRLALFIVHHEEGMAWATAEEEMIWKTTEVPDSVESETDFRTWNQ